jgi:tetratricopeptide (TPR) repeat protein
MAEFMKKVFPGLHRKGRDSEAVQHVLDLFSRGAYKEACDRLRDIMERELVLSEPEIAVVYMLRADLELFAHGDTCEAQKWLDKSKELVHPETGYFDRIQGDIKLRSGNPQAAVEDYERSVALEPAVGNLTMLAHALSMVQDDRAKDVWTRILKEDPQNCLAHVGLACEAARSGDRRGALLMAKKAEQLHPSAEETLQIGRVYHMIGEFQVAVSAYLQADSLGYEKKARLHAGIAACYWELGQTEQAQQSIKSALQYDSQDEYARIIWENIGSTG